MREPPPKLVRRAHDALSRLCQTLARHPDTAAELAHVLGPELLDALRSASVAVGRAHALLAPQSTSHGATTPSAAPPPAKALGDPNLVAERRLALAQPHMQPLVRFAKNLRESAPAPVADFDPYDGGIEAEVLVLLEAPGPQTARTGFISRDNPDETAKAWLELNAETGLPRQRTAIWNAVPWIIRGAPSSDDLHAAEPHLRHVLTLFPHLRVIVLVGRKAESAAALVVDAVPNGIVVLRCPHPSPQNLRTRPEARIQIRTVLLQVRDLLHD